MKGAGSLSRELDLARPDAQALVALTERDLD